MEGNAKLDSKATKRLPSSDSSLASTSRGTSWTKRPDSPLLQHWVLNDFHFEDLLKDGSEKEEHNNNPMLDIPQDINHMLGVVVSTVMMLAHGHPKCPHDNLRCASLFLRNIKDNRGDIPHNIASILNIIQVIMKANDKPK